MQGNERPRGGTAEHNAVGVNPPWIALLCMGLSEVAHGRFGVVHPAKHRLLKRRLQIKHVVDSKAIADRRRNVPHAGQVLTQRNHIDPVIAARKKEPTVGQNHHRPVRHVVSCGQVHVHVELFVGP